MFFFFHDTLHDTMLVSHFSLRVIPTSITKCSRMQDRTWELTSKPKKIQERHKRWLMAYYSHLIHQTIVQSEEEGNFFSDHRSQARNVGG